jgi:hypothetical protein
LALCKLKLQVQHANIRTCVGNRYDIFAAKVFDKSKIYFT